MQLAILALRCLSMVCVAKGNNMRKVITTGTVTTALTTAASNAASAPQQAIAQGGALAVLAPSTQPHPGTLAIAGTPSTAKTATNGVGPAPGPRTVGYAALQCIAAGNGAPVALASVQAAITAVGLKGSHPVMPLLRWLASKRGYSFTVHNGTHVSMA